MGDAGQRWIAPIIIGGIAGWLAKQFMKSSIGTDHEYRAWCCQCAYC